MNAGVIRVLESIGWQLFVSCTVKERGASDVYLTKRFFAFARFIARMNHVHFNYLPWAFRIESGFDPLHRHFHFLVGSLNRLSQSDRFRMINFWNVLLGGSTDNVKGTCRVRLYNGVGGLSSYLAKEVNCSEVQGWLSGDVRISNAGYKIAWQRNNQFRNPLHICAVASAV